MKIKKCIEIDFDEDDAVDGEGRGSKKGVEIGFDEEDVVGGQRKT